jgi:FtsZ-binding cell division protein ZapB
MSAVLDQLEERVNAVADLVRNLRREVSRLEHELADRPLLQPTIPQPSPPPPASPADAALLEEITRLRDERALVRERVRGLIREIDQVAW